MALSSLRYRASYLVGSAVRGLLASPVPTGVAVGTIAIALVVAGLFGLVLKQMNLVIERMGDELEVTAFLDDGLGPERIAELERIAATVEGVERVELVTKDEARARFEARIADGARLLEGFRENPLPASLEISLAPAQRSPRGMQVVVESLDGLAGIEELAYGQDWIAGYTQMVGVVRGGAIALGAVLSLATLLIVANTVRLAVYARRDELEILALVGASRSFVRIPFLLEGLVEGFLGAVFALVLLLVIFLLVLPGLSSGLEFWIGHARPEFFGAAESLGLLLLGSLLGLLGAGAALASDWSRS